jgi:hypothetical protein
LTGGGQRNPGQETLRSCPIIAQAQGDIKTEVPKMNSSSYKIYITKSCAAAHHIARGLREATPWSKRGGHTIATSCGCVLKDCRIPEIYHGSDRFYALIEYRNGETFDFPEFNITHC